MGTHTQEEIAEFPSPNQTHLDLQNQNFIQTLPDRNQDEKLLKEMLYILHMVTGDVVISSAVPFPSH